MKKVLFLIPSLAHGGAEKVLVNLVNHLDKSKFDITVQTLFDGGVNKQYLKPHIKTNSVFKRVFPGNSKIFTLFSPRFLYKNMIREHFDIVVSYLEGPTARIVSGCSEEITKLVCWIHVQQDTLAIACSSFRNYQEAKKCYDRFDEIICVSEYVKSKSDEQLHGKEFTLEDLNFGGRNYRNFVAKNQYYTWWGDQLIRQDVEECYIVDKKTGKESKLFSLDEINLWAKSDDQKRVRHLLNANFPYPTQPIVAVGNGKAFTLVNFQTRQIVWQDSLSGQKANDWQAISRATAFVRDHQLFVIDVQGQLHQITTDGSRDIVYGEAVHRNEFGIHQGTFWNPDGSKLAFYRMDQSMVEDYPQVDIFCPIALHDVPLAVLVHTGIHDDAEAVHAEHDLRFPVTQRPPGGKLDAQRPVVATE